MQRNFFCFLTSVLLSFLFFGCVHTNGIAKIAVNPTNIPDQIKIAVPHIAQNDDYSCATTSLAMALSYYRGDSMALIDKDFAWTVSRANKETVRKIGNDMESLGKLASYFGFSSEFCTDLTIDQIEFLLSRGILCILNIRTKGSFSEAHAVLAIGYDKIDKKIFVNDPANMIKEISYKDLEENWLVVLSKPYGFARNSVFILYQTISEK